MPNDFNLINESGVWTAGRVDFESSANFSSFTEATEDENWRVWNMGDSDLWGNGLVWISLKDFLGSVEGELVIHPGTGADKATGIRWTVPSGFVNRSFRIKGMFRLNVNSGDRDVTIRLGEKTLFSENGTIDDQEFDFTIKASSGDTLDFVVGSGPSWTNEAAGFSVVITAE